MTIGIQNCAGNFDLALFVSNVGDELTVVAVVRTCETIGADSV